MEYLMTYWRESLEEAKEQLEKEPFTASRAILRQRIANYREWIARGEKI